jgi:UDP-N-acetylmuramate dehydrogenase
MRESGSELAIEENAPLAPYTTLGVGGPAHFFLKAKTEEQIIGGLQFARKRNCPVFIMGGGSNLVVSDSGYPGMVLKIELSGIESMDEKSGVRVSAASGEGWDAMVRHCVDRNLAGIECLSGIPGTVGGTPVQNIGAYGQEVSEVINRVRVLDRNTCSVTNLGNADCRFSYRTSTFNTADRDHYVVLRVDFVLHPNGEPRIQYHDLKRRFSSNRRLPSIQEVRQAVLEIREAKGMILCDRDPDSRSVGSFFKNPILNPDETALAEDKAHSCGILAPSERIPCFTIPSGQEKLAAAWLVERAGFFRGFSSGRAGISSKHCLALVNRGGASAQEIVDLMRAIQERVRSVFEIELQPEPVFVGFEDP